MSNISNVVKSSVVLTAMALISINAFAKSPLKMPLDQEDRVETKVEKIARISERIQNKAYDLGPRKLKQLNQDLKAVIDSLKSIEQSLSGGSRPGPGPAPRPPRGGVQSITGSIESYSFQFEATDSFDLVQQCTSQFTGIISKADDVSVSVDFQPLRSERNSSSWWQGAGGACAQVAEMAVDQGLSPRSNNRNIVAVGSIELASFSFEGRTLSEVYSQCTSFVNSKFTKVDDYTVFDGHRSNSFRNSSSWWNAGEVCNLIVNAVK